MPFTGKSTYAAGASLPELAEDVSDVIGIVSPYETPLLDHLGDPQRSARSTIHEWLEDSLLPNKDTINDVGISGDTSSTSFTVSNGDRFRVGDQVQADNAAEVMLVTAISTATRSRSSAATAAPRPRRSTTATRSASSATPRSRATTRPPPASPTAPA